MKKFSLVILILVFGVCLFAGMASATWINPSGGGNGSETSLQGVLNNITNGGTSSVDASGTDNASLPDGADSIWQISATGVSAATMIIEIAGFASQNVFGIYDPYDISRRVQLFAGSDTSGDKIAISNDAADQSWVISHLSAPLTISDTGIVFSSSYFGYYLTSPDGTFYSDTSKNPDLYDHLVAFQGTGDMVKLPGSSDYRTWTNAEYILGWEDRLSNLSDKDYQDLVIMVESVNPAPVPEPATMLLLGSGLIGLAGFGRKRLLKKA